MTTIMFRVWLLWGVLTLLILWFFGFNQWARLWEVVEVSTPQVEAFISGITAIGWRQLPFVLLAFFYRRAVILAVKKTVQAVLFILLETHWRRALSAAMLLPAHYTSQGIQRVRTWRELNSYLLLHSWFLYFYTATVLTAGTFLGAELFLAIVRGSLALPPIIVRYQAQLVTFAGAFVAATIAQSILLFLWDRLYGLLPPFVHRQVEYLRWPVFRRLVKLRYWRRRLTRGFFSWGTLLFVLVFFIALCAPI